MTSAPAKERYRAPLPARAMLALILGPATCVTCLEPLASPLHRELCEVAGGQPLDAPQLAVSRG